MHPLSPLDGRYAKVVEGLAAYFSEDALMRGRVEVEVRYLLALSEVEGLAELKRITQKQQKSLEGVLERFGERDVAAIRALERKTNHDVKAVEYYLQGKLGGMGLRHAIPFLHFGLTSEDVNNLAYGILIHRALKDMLRPELRGLLATLGSLGRRWKSLPMLGLTHGQPATPTTVGREFLVFVERLGRQLAKLYEFKMHGKFGGAVGTLAAHRAAYPKVKWERFGAAFVRSLGLVPLRYTTQINPHDDLAELSHLLVRINTILLGLCRDAWMYISRGIFTQRVNAGEVGSSTMPHKVNPIDFENAEGNLGVSSALFTHFAAKLPVSRLQRDLSDSTVQRNLGVAFGHHLLAVKSLQKGLGKLQVDRSLLRWELEQHPEVHAEAVQTVMRRYGIVDAYEQLKRFTRGREVTREGLEKFIRDLPIPKGERERLAKIVGR